MWLYDKDCDEYMKDDLLLDSLHKARYKDIKIEVGDGTNPNMKLMNNKYLQKRCEELLSAMHTLKSNCQIVAQKIILAVFATNLDKWWNMKTTNKNDGVEVNLNENYKEEESREKETIINE